ncbi:unnamed protein product [Thlaspi arvense]|uniref:Uncharacterized protein n=1 Tax=Thlaspi arvense TaxID=13288 RepID=A0AAU9R5N4_THLAR|nr:unnamed protein product [Thlaspi arvense]
MKIKGKGKVHPSPPLPSFSSSDGDDRLSVLKLLPAVILVLVSALSTEDREVLAYLITRSLKTTTTTTATAVSAGGRSPSDSKKPSRKKRTHKPPISDCECFDCYTSYWFRWDSSPNRELIHQIIEAFEDHLTKGENSASQKSNSKGKKKEKSGRRRVVEPSGRPEEPIAKTTEPVEPVVVPDEVTPDKSPEILADEMEKPTETRRLPVAAASGHKGLARKVLPDVLGLFNSRFWSLWNPNA